MTRDVSLPDAPRTAVLHQFVGMGDLVWHIPYFRVLAEQSQGGQLSVIASPTTFARDLLGHEPWVREVIDFDRRPRRSEKRQGRHSGVMGLVRMAQELKPYGFERIIMFTHHANRALVAWMAGIPQRMAYGSSAIQRAFLTQARGIQGYAGPAVPVYKDASAFMQAQGWCAEPIVPRLVVRQDALATMRERLAGLPAPLCALNIGSSEPFKQWGAERFTQLIRLLRQSGCGVIVLGGPGEQALAQEIAVALSTDERRGLLTLTDCSVAESTAALSLARACVGNDTGATNIAAAVGTPTWVLLGPRPPLEHDPETLRLIQAPRLLDISPAQVLAVLEPTLSSPRPVQP